jgi:hypothetical protein
MTLSLECHLKKSRGSSWCWSYGSWIYSYLCNQWHATGWWFSSGTRVSSTYETDCHDITEILLKVALNTIAIATRIKIICYLTSTIKLKGYVSFKVSSIGIHNRVWCKTVVLILGEKVRGKKRTSSPAISETSSESQSEDLLARARRRSRSSTAEKDRGEKNIFLLCRI